MKRRVPRVVHDRLREIRSRRNGASTLSRIASVARQLAAIGWFLLWAPIACVVIHEIYGQLRGIVFVIDDLTASAEAEEVGYTGRWAATQIGNELELIAGEMDLPAVGTYSSGTSRMSAGARVILPSGGSSINDFVLWVRDILRRRNVWVGGAISCRSDSLYVALRVRSVDGLLVTEVGGRVRDRAADSVLIRAAAEVMDRIEPTATAAYYMARDAARCERSVVAALTDDNPDNDIYAWAAWGYCALLVSKDYEAAYARFREASVREPTRASLYLLMAQSAQGMGDSVLTDSSLARALESAPTDANVQSNAGQIYFEWRNYSRAAEAFQAAIRSDSTDFLSHYMLARCLEIRGDTGSACDHYRQAVLTNPREVSLYVDHALCLVNDGNTRGAIDLLRIAIGLDSMDVGVNVMLCSCFVSLGEISKAKASMQRAVSSQRQAFRAIPDGWGAYWISQGAPPSQQIAWGFRVLAKSYERQGDSTEFCRACQTILEYDDSGEFGQWARRKLDSVGVGLEG